MQIDVDTLIAVIKAQTQIFQGDLKTTFIYTGHRIFVLINN